MSTAPNKTRKFSEGMLDNETILNNLNICPGQTILDAGCGNGYMSKAFAKTMRNAGKIYALDPDENSIQNLKREVRKSIIEPITGDITQTTILKKSSIDLVYLSTVFHIFSDVQVRQFDIEVKRILKPMATLAIVNIKKEPTSFGPPLEMRSSPEELRKRLSLTPKALIDIGKHFYMQLFTV